MRDSGAVLSLDLLTANNGTFTIAHDASYGDYALDTPAAVTLPAGTEKVFGSYLPTLNWPSTDATADWALSGRMMQAMWLQATGQQVNGVIGMDVPGVARILDLTGPVTVPGEATPVSSSNIADLLLNKAYQGLTVNDPQAERRDMIAAVVKAAVDKMKTEHVDLDSFANALAYDVDGRHLMVWSDVPSAESGLVALDAAGTLNSAQSDRTFHIAVENATADKLDYFVGVSVGMKVTVEASGGALVNTTVSLANSAQPGHAPSYQYGPDDAAGGGKSLAAGRAARQGQLLHLHPPRRGRRSPRPAAGAPGQARSGPPGPHHVGPGLERVGTQEGLPTLGQHAGLTLVHDTLKGRRLGPPTLVG